jgi:gluconolactonase
VLEVNDPDLLRLIDRDVPIEQLCTGFRFSEGPIWNPKEQCLYFSDMPNDIRRRWSPRDGVVEVRNPSNKCNDMKGARQSGRVHADGLTSPVSKTYRTGSRS